jgi:hypothetical protein
LEIEGTPKDKQVVDYFIDKEKFSIQSKLASIYASKTINGLRYNQAAAFLLERCGDSNTAAEGLGAVLLIILFARESNFSLHACEDSDVRHNTCCCTNLASTVASKQAALEH